MSPFFQAQDVRKYLKLKGAEISEEKSSKGIEDDLHKIIGVCDVCFKDGDPVEIDAILNSIVSIMVTVSVFFYFLSDYDVISGTQIRFNNCCQKINRALGIVLTLFLFSVQIPLERGENIVLAFCEKLTKAPEIPLAKVCLQS